MAAYHKLQWFPHEKTKKQVYMHCILYVGGLAGHLWVKVSLWDSFPISIGEERHSMKERRLLKWTNASWNFSLEDNFWPDN